jgi:hypothetical protein
MNVDRSRGKKSAIDCSCLHRDDQLFNDQSEKNVGMLLELRPLSSSRAMKSSSSLLAGN